MSSRPAGFTTVELIVAVTISMLIAAGIMMYMVAWIGGYAITSARTNLRTDSRRALSIISDDIRLASNAVDYNQWPDDNAPTAPATLLGSSPADTDQHYYWRSSAHQLILIRPARTVTGNVIYDDPANFTGKKDNYVYYVDTVSKTLHRRTIPVPASTYPTNALAISNCGPPTVVGGCSSNDFVLARNIGFNGDGTPAFNISYYNNVGTPISGATSVRAVVISLTLSVTQNGQPLSVTNNIRMEFRNN